jgi:DNA polymerase-3 subunit epsilon
MAFFHKHAGRIGARFEHPVFDTVLLSAILFGQGEPHTLDALADRFGVVIPEADRHTAMGDTIATAEVFQRMIPMLEARGIDTFDKVLEAMQKNSRLMREMRARVGG